MTRQNRNRLAAALAVLLGLLSLQEGGSALLGFSDRTDAVLPWLVWYYVVIGFLSVLAGRGLWQTRTWANKLADTIVTLHGLVLLNLVVLFAFKEAVALIGIAATFFSTLAWIGIILLTRWRVAGYSGAE
jgi:hypothetical protein